MAGYWGFNSGYFAPPAGSFTNAFLNDNPQAAYNQALGIGTSQAAPQQFLRGLYGQTYQDYLGQAATRGPDYGFTNYLAENLPKINSQWTTASPQQRGERDPTQRLRWVV
jgi:hypothetical protein